LLELAEAEKQINLLLIYCFLFLVILVISLKFCVLFIGKKVSKIDQKLKKIINQQQILYVFQSVYKHKKGCVYKQNRKFMIGRNSFYYSSVLWDSIKYNFIYSFKIVFQNFLKIFQIFFIFQFNKL